MTRMKKQKMKREMYKIKQKNPSMGLKRKAESFNSNEMSSREGLKWEKRGLNLGDVIT